MSTLSRVIFNPDTTPPTVPTTVAAVALSQTAIRISWAASTDTGGSGLAGYRVYRSSSSTGTYSQIGTDLTTASLSYDDSGLSAGTTWFYRVAAFDGNSNVSAFSATTSATTISSGSGDANDGLIVTNYTSYDPDAATIISLDLNSTLPHWGTTGGADVQFRTGTWWNGSSVQLVDLFPPTVEQSSGIGEIFLWKNASKVVRQLNIRFEWQPTAEYCANGTSLPKFIIVNTTRTLSSSSDAVDRPMLYLAHMTEADDTNLHIQNSVVLCPAQGTTRLFSESNPTPAHSVYNYPDPVTYPNQRQPIYWRATAGTDGAGNPIIAASEVVTIEMRVNVMATAQEPLGFIGVRIYRRNGQVFERSCAWTWGDGNEQPDQAYIMSIQQMGGGYYNIGQPRSPTIRTTMGRRLTIATNYQPTVGRAWIGAPQGFVQ